MTSKKTEAEIEEMQDSADGDADTSFTAFRFLGELFKKDAEVSLTTLSPWLGLVPGFFIISTPWRLR